MESAIKARPGVYDTVAVGAADPRWGVTVVAVVQLRPEQYDLMLRQLPYHCRERIAGHLVAEVRRTPTGEPDLRRARQVAAVGPLR